MTRNSRTWRGLTQVVGGAALVACLVGSLSVRTAGAATGGAGLGGSLGSGRYGHIALAQEHRGLRPMFDSEPIPPGHGQGQGVRPFVAGHAAQRPVQTLGAPLSAGALPAGLAPVLARTLWHGTGRPSASWNQQAELTASDGSSHASFSGSIALSGDGNMALIGAPGQNRAYVFVRSATTWTQQAEFTTSVSKLASAFGASVALSENTALIGAPYGNPSTGAAYVFVRSGTTWSQQAILTPSDGAPHDAFGTSVALNGSTALVGADGRNNFTGAAYVFTRSGRAWSQRAKLAAGDGASGDQFGLPVALSAGTALVGADGRNNYTGAVYVFTRIGTIWSQQTELTASDGAPNNYFGNAVALSGDGNTALIGAEFGTYGAGAAYVFGRSGTTWSQQAELTAGDIALGDQFGYAVALSRDDTTALIGAPNKNGSTGAVYVFGHSGTTWSNQAELMAADGAGRDQFGNSVALSGDTDLIGAWGKIQHIGAAYVFVRS